jgi:hypothetical protein
MTVRKSPAWTDADYEQRRGFGRLNLRLPLEIIRKLRLIAASENKHQQTLIEEMITNTHKRVFNGK